MNIYSKKSAAGLLGLARRAGMVEQGVSSTRKALRQNRANLVLIAEDGSKIQREKIDNILKHKNVPTITWGTCEGLGAIFGTQSVAAVAVTDPAMATQMFERLSQRSFLSSSANLMETGE